MSFPPFLFSNVSKYMYFVFSTVSTLQYCINVPVRDNVILLQVFLTSLRLQSLGLVAFEVQYLSTGSFVIRR